MMIIHTGHRATECFSGIIIPPIIHLVGVCTMIRFMRAIHITILSGTTDIMCGTRGIHLMSITDGLHGDTGTTPTTAGTEAVICIRGVRGDIRGTIRCIHSETEAQRVRSEPPVVIPVTGVHHAEQMYGSRLQEEQQAAVPV